MSRKEVRPSRAFSLRYLATQEFEVSLSSATAVATLGSFLSMLMVFLTLLITSSVSFTYSSSLAANAGETGNSHAGDRVAATRDNSCRRWHFRVPATASEDALTVKVAVVDLGLRVGSGLG